MTIEEWEYHEEFYRNRYQRIYESRLCRKLHARIVEKVLMAAQWDATSKVLSLGCGAGHIERALAPYVGEVLGLDISRQAIGHACQRSLEAGLTNTRFAVADVGDGHWGNEDAKYDGICAFSLLHHLNCDVIARVLSEACA